MASLMQQLLDPGRRLVAARELAEACGARDAVLFIYDAELRLRLPAPGFPHTALCTAAQDCKDVSHLTVAGAPATVMRIGRHAIALLDHSQRRIPSEVMEWLPVILHALALEHRNEGLRNDLERRVSERTHQLEDEYRNLQEVDDLKTSFLRLVSHELRTPLNAIIGFSHVLNDGLAGAISPQQSEYVGMVLEAGNELLTLVTHLLEMAQVEAARIASVQEAVNLRSLVDGAVSRVSTTAAEKGVQLSVDVDAELEAMADPIALHRLLLILLDFTVRSSGASTIEIVARASEDVRIEVRQTDPQGGDPRGIQLRMLYGQRLAQQLGTEIVSHHGDGGEMVFSLSLPAVRR